MSHRSVPRIRITNHKPQKEISLPRKARHLGLEITGYGNTVRVAEGNFCAQISIFGCNNTVIVEENATTGSDCRVQLGDAGCPVFNSVGHIGKNIRMARATIFLLESGSSVRIGDDCMLSTDVEVWCTDSHAVFAPDGSLRYGREIVLGNKVWVGLRSLIGKNTVIADGCIVGWGSVVSGKFLTPNCIIAGSPATVRKEGVSWKHPRPDEFRPEKAAELAEFADWNRPGRSSLFGRIGLRCRLAYYALFSALSRRPASKERLQGKMAAIRERLH